MDTKKFKANSFPFDSLPLELQLMVFKYLSSKDRINNLSFVSKSWAENLQFFTEDYELHLYDCYLKEETEPYSILMNPTRKYRFLKLGHQFTSENPLLVSRLLSHLGKYVHILDISSTDGFSSLKESNSLLMFPELKKLIVTKMSDLMKFDIFPESLEHIHVNQLSVMEQTKEVDHMKKIKNLRCWTSELIQIKGGLDALVEIASQFGTISTTIFNLDEKLKELLESLQTLDNIYLKLSTNFIDTPVVQINDVIGIELKEAPKSFLKFNELPHLKSIHFRWDINQHPESPCYDNHEVQVCSNVEEIEIKWIRDRTCMGCFRTLIDSLPNLKKLILLDCKFENEHFKYVCFKLPHLKQLEVESNQIDSQILFNDQPQYLLENLRTLHTLNLSESTISNIDKWPFMPNLKKLKLAGASYMPEENLKQFCRNLPNLEFFETGDATESGDYFIENLTQHLPNLKTLRLLYLMDLTQRDFTAITSNCKKLRTLEMSSTSTYLITEYNLFKELSSLRKIVYDERTFYREDFHNMGHYLKRHGMPYDEIGALQSVVDEYSFDDSDENEESDES
uniref:CSON010611 protein n=1 Tax=Culicoides sonorensis TaxID=179676 RepID=A0A336M4L9_CULSO